LLEVPGGRAVSGYTCEARTNKRRTIRVTHYQAKRYQPYSWLIEVFIGKKLIFGKRWTLGAIAAIIDMVVKIQADERKAQA
jgi:hypothetical protein